MEIILTNTDFEALIKEKYDGVSEVKFNSKNIKATLVITDIIKFKLFERKNAQILQSSVDIKQLPEKTLEERQEDARKKGLMSPGGTERVLIRS